MLFRIAENRALVQKAELEDASIPLIALAPVTPRDHVRGTPSSGIYAIEYADLECPFCKTFHIGMKEVIGKHPDVGFVFRHYPLDHRFPLSRREAEAAECAYAQKGHDGFFLYLDLLFKKTNSENSLVEQDLFDLAREARLDGERFKSCYDGRDFKDRVEKDRVGGALAGVASVPSVLIVKNGVAQALLKAPAAYQVERALEDIKYASQ